MLKRRRFKVIFHFSVGVLMGGLAACGGGGDGGGSSIRNEMAPSIITHPHNTAVIEGETATFSVTADGEGPFSYQWKKNGAHVGENSPSYTIPITTLGDNGAKFSVVLSNEAGSIVSNEATLTVTATAVAPSITSPPQDTSVVEGQAATFSVTAAGTAPLSYQWKKNGAHVGENSSSYTPPIPTAADNGAKFSVVVTNEAGYAVSNDATLTVTATSVAPSITSHPQNTAVIEGQSATFSVTAAGTAPFSYQWKKNGSNVGANLSSYTTPITTLGDNGARFSVVVTNAAGRAESNEASLTVTATGMAPTISSHPQSTAVIEGQTTTFSVTATGTVPFSYQWKKNGSNVGDNSSSYTTPIITAGDNGARFSVVVTNTAGRADSNEAILTVNPNPGSAILVTHANTDLPRVPSAWIAAAKNTLKIAYGHTSHGSQVLAGMSTLAAADATYSFNTGGAGGALDMRDTPFYGADDLGNPDRTSWATATRSYLNSNPEVNVVMWSWCGQVSDASTNDITTYLNLMNGLENDYPRVKFVYMTGHLDGSGVSGNLNQRNEQIRAYCRANNKILFDFADIESYDPGGATNFMALNADDGCNYAGGNWATQWISAHPTDPLTALAAACGNCEHSEKLNCILKGRAAWWLWARLAGWNGQ